jgi:hypothetical protein
LAEFFNALGIPLIAKIPREDDVAINKNKPSEGDHVVITPSRKE